MDFFEDFDEEKISKGPPDPYELQAYETIQAFFASHNDTVFFGRQIEVIHEGKFFHWVSNRALRLLVENHVIKSEKRLLKWGGSITIYWYSTLRYYRRPALETIAVVESYSEDLIGSSTGTHCELLVVEGFSKLQFLNLGRNVRSFNGKRWTNTAHDLDMIVERDGVVYGVEVKNTLRYMDKKEYQVKVELCHYLGIKPVFVARMLPQSWIINIKDAGGFSLILKYLLYPELLKSLALQMRTHLFLPVETPRSLWDGTLKRFEDWHIKNVK